MNNGAWKVIYGIFDINEYYNLNNPNNLNNLNNLNNPNNNSRNNIRLMDKLKLYEAREYQYGFVNSIIPTIPELILTQNSSNFEKPEQTIHTEHIEHTEQIEQTIHTEQTVHTEQIEQIVQPNVFQSNYIDINKQKLLIHNIMMVGNIKPHEKFWLENDVLTIDNSYFPRFTRWRFKQKREIIIEFIEEIVRECIDILKNKNKNSDNIKQCNSMLISYDDMILVNSFNEIKEQSVLVINGLENMKMTYPDKINEIDKIIDLLKDNKIDLLTSKII